MDLIWISFHSFLNWLESHFGQFGVFFLFLFLDFDNKFLFFWFVDLLLLLFAFLDSVFHSFFSSFLRRKTHLKFIFPLIPSRMAQFIDLLNFFFVIYFSLTSISNGIVRFTRITLHYSSHHIFHCCSLFGYMFASVNALDLLSSFPFASLSSSFFLIISNSRHHLHPFACESEKKSLLRCIEMRLIYCKACARLYVWCGNTFCLTGHARNMCN